MENQLSKVEQLKTQLTTDLETAKVQQTFEGIDGVSTNLTEIVHTSEALADSAAHTSVKEMIKPSGDARIDAEFDKIMGKKKDSASKN